ncbi:MULTISPECIES: hypothetical protein [unclassified Methylobacterium]|uniref:hypothetical protein n=1 Tax=unclassified Methylobacterium TaxID=2615210 RepID=UPI0013528A3F|nr:hypothetical protein [Methylobacterium sp. 2A]MWV21653.1 hypothetical protein [Methylobacterium sp. 2A]
MTRASTQQIRALSEPLIDRNYDVSFTGGKFLCVQNVGHIARQIRVYNRPSRGYFTLEWRLTELYIRGDKFDFGGYGRSIGMIGRSRQFKPAGKGGVWDWDDPTIFGDFVNQIEIEVLPLLQSLDSIEKTVTFILSQEMRGYLFHKDHIWMAFTNAALGEFAIAKKHWDLITPSFKERYEKQKMTRDGLISGYLQSCVAVGEALQAGDQMALAKLLWENERTEADRFKLGRHWQPTAFPFQKAKPPIAAACVPDQR